MKLTSVVRFSARELTLDAAQATRGVRTSSKLLDRNQMRKLLDSRNEREVLEGLRRVIAVRSAFVVRLSRSILTSYCHCR